MYDLMIQGYEMPDCMFTKNTLLPHMTASGIVV